MATTPAVRFSVLRQVAHIRPLLAVMCGANFPQEEVTKMKSLCFRVILVAVAACGLTAFCTSPAVAQDAASTFKAKCAMCHGADGKGGKMGTKDFASPDIQKLTDAQLTETISKGKPPKMPAYEGKLKDTEIKDLVAYIRGLGSSR